MRTVIITTILILFSTVSFPQEVFQWRGQERDGIFNEEKLLKEWPEKGPEILWLNENIGEGYGSVAVTDDMIFVNGKVDSLSYTFALDLKGKLIWKTANGLEFTGEGFPANFPGSRSTPTVDDDLLYVSSATGRIACLYKQTGKEKWAVDMIRDFNGIPDQHGYSESLVTDEKNVYCFPGGADQNIVSLDRFTGKTVWTSKALSDTVSYCSPLIINNSEQNILVTFSGHYLLGLDIKTGKLLWSQAQDYHRFHQQCNTPINDKGHLYYVAGEGNGAVKLELSDDGKSIKEIWRNSNIKNVFGGFILKHNSLYSPEGNYLKCLDKNTGEVTDSLRLKKGSLIIADDMLYLYSDNGFVNLIKLTGSKPELVSKFRIEKGTKEHFAHPVISKGVLYIRHGKALIAYNLKEN